MRVTSPHSPQNDAPRRRAVDLTARKNSQTAAATADARRTRLIAGDFCYLTRPPNNMPVRIVDYVSARSATWLAHPDGFEPPTPRFVVWRYIQPAIAQDIERKRQERVKVLA
jgi:hypothetical protein